MSEIDMNACKAQQKPFGHFSEHAEVAQNIKEALGNGTSYAVMTCAQKEALEMIAHNMAAIVTGNPSHRPHWANIFAYTCNILLAFKK